MAASQREFVNLGGISFLKNETEDFKDFYCGNKFVEQS